MPELPEVETIRRQLAPHLVGRRLQDVEIMDPRWTRPVDPAVVAAELRGARVDGLARAGKYLIWELSGDRFLFVHLRMTGALLWDPPQEPSHMRARFGLDGGHQLAYVDPRRFGTGHLVVGSEARDLYLQERLGVEPFSPEFTARHLRALGRDRVVPVKSFLLDQRRVAGVGNIYADEALFRARVHPLRPAGRLTLAQWEAVRAGVEEALRAGIDAKGASIDDFRHVDGARGSFQDRFLVHRREGLPCPVCGTPVRKFVVGGRGTYACEHCQPRPRGSRAGPGKRAGAGKGAGVGEEAGAGKGARRRAARSDAQPDRRPATPESPRSTRRPPRSAET